MTKRRKAVDGYHSVLPSGWCVELLLLLVCCCFTECYGQLNARADFNMNGVGGHILFSWNLLSRQLTINTHGLTGISPQDLTSGLQWHAHEFPFKLGVPDPCGAHSTGGHFDPLGRAKAPNYARLCQSQMSMRFRDCEIGDFSGKFGPLQLQREYVELTPNISLSGNFGIAGRSLVIHRAGKRWVCANIEPVLQHKTTCSKTPAANQKRTLVAKFKWPVAGEVFIRQVNIQGGPVQPNTPLPAGQPTNTALVNISTVLFSHLYWIDQKAAQGPVQSATAFLPPMPSNTARAFTGPGQRTLPMGIRPFQAVPTGASPSYMWQIESQPVHQTAQFSASPQRRCSGTGRTLVSLSNMLGPLRVGIDPNSASTSKTLYSTNNSIFYPIDNFIRKSLIILDPTRRTRIACATIHEIHPAVAKATFPDGVGTVSFSQRSEFDETHVTANFQKLFNVAGEYGIRSYSIPTANGRENTCGARLTGNLFNPWTVQRLPTSGQSANSYPVGDLSGKFGNLRGRFNFRKQMCDVNLPMFGANSVVGRTLVIEHQNRQQSPIACARLDLQLQRNSRLHKAKVDFTGPVVGTVLLEQEQFADGQLGNTYIKSFGLRNFNNWLTQGHQYHIHVGRIGILRDPRNPSGHCANAFAGPHYNPFNTSIDPTYAKQCSPQNPYRCELGDTSKKTSYLAVRGMPQYHVDADMPLTGRFTAVGRSMVIHNPNGAAARLACGNVIPQQAKDVIMLLHTDPRTFSAQYFKQRVAATLGLASQNVMFLRALPHGPCTAVSFVLDGPGAEENSQHLLRSNLGTYTHEPRCAHPSQIVTAAPFTDPNRGDRGSAARHGLQQGNSIVLLLTAFCLAVYLHES